MKKLACVLALASAFAATNAHAWGNDGHRAVGAIADKLLKGTNAQKQLAAILFPGESLESIANWADCVKGTYCGPQNAEMVEYVKSNPKHSTYHYTDVPYHHTRYVDGGPGTFDDDIVKTLQQAIAVLQGKAENDRSLNPKNFTKRQALLLLVHLIGDIHQPLHVGAAYVGKDGKFVVPITHADIDTVTIFDSRGGNNFLMDEGKIAAMEAAHFPGQPLPVREGVPKSLTKPFHSFWDTTVVNYAMRLSSTKTPGEFAQYAIESEKTLTLNTGEPMTWPYQWASDALTQSRIAYENVAPGPFQQQVSRNGETYYTWTLEVPPNYSVPGAALARTQLIKGGYNLAAVLTEILK